MTDAGQDHAVPRLPTDVAAFLPGEIERRAFRRSRMVDAACALPFLGLLLWLLPLLWHAPDTRVTTADALVYIFAVWVALPLATGLLIRAIRRNSAPDRPGAAGARR